MGDVIVTQAEPIEPWCPMCGTTPVQNRGEAHCALHEAFTAGCPVCEDVNDGFIVNEIRQAASRAEVGGMLQGVEFIDAVAAAALAASGREQGAPCENCGKPVEVGHVVIPYDDVGEMHADCARPFDTSVVQPDDAPKLCVLLGQPMLQVPLAALHLTPSIAGDSVAVPMILHCPRCHHQHIDEPDERTPDWDNPPHRSHLCHQCGCIWRPADVPTEGVATLATVGKADNWQPAAPDQPNTPGLRDAASRSILPGDPYAHADGSRECRPIGEGER